ncbi:juvenile hormone acid O-methyltransferase-like isoform X2 [Neodiprion virginianus]|uniref:juvenile hormone acid O-methyltransferase-like isoform X2 n=1 Tax=Neodiprion virginianus TaxID=2961670 RepID=UPI001EE718FA|nr:juvenile hormone acid O-methyltransferase-like isoform X2 [Neodiprion virginianus]
MFKPALYSKINNEARRDTRDFIEEYSNEIGQMSGRCLDIGSGPCDVVTDFLLPKLNPKSTVVCSDISKPMLDYAKEKYGANDRLSFLQLDIESPTLAEDLVEQFDHVTSFYCLHWCEDMRQAFENIFELLRPGGSGFLTFVSDFSCMDAYKVLAAIPRYQRYMTLIANIFQCKIIFASWGEANPIPPSLLPPLELTVLCPLLPFPSSSRRFEYRNLLPSSGIADLATAAYIQMRTGSFPYFSTPNIHART